MRVDYSMISRVLASTLGAYALAYAFAAACARLLPGDAADAAMIAALLSFALLTAFVPWIFSRRTACRAWGVVALAIPLAAVGFWPQLWSLVP